MASLKMTFSLGKATARLLAATARCVKPAEERGRARRGPRLRRRGGTAGGCGSFSAVAALRRTAGKDSWPSAPRGRGRAGRNPSLPAELGTPTVSDWSSFDTSVPVTALAGDRCLAAALRLVVAGDEPARIPALVSCDGAVRGIRRNWICSRSSFPRRDSCLSAFPRRRSLRICTAC